MNYDESKETLEMLERFKKMGKDGVVFCRWTDCVECPFGTRGGDCFVFDRKARYAKVLERLEALKGGDMKRGDRVYVSDHSVKYALQAKEKRIFLANIGGIEPYVCVSGHDEHLYPDGDYRTASWKYAVPILQEKPVPEYTMEELAEKLGHDFKLVKGETK